MRVWVLLTLIVVFSNCKMHKSALPGESYGIITHPADSSIIKGTHVLRLGNRRGVVFPMEYGKKIFGKLDSATIFFTPDTNLIRKINKEINSQYCAAYKKYNAKIEMSTDVTLSMSKKYCELWNANELFYDKQYIGYINKIGEKVIIINLIDFRQDPHHLKQSFTTFWIQGWHGWFYSNVIDLYFNADKNLLMISKDI